MLTRGCHVNSYDFLLLSCLRVVTGILILYRRRFCPSHVRPIHVTVTCGSYSSVLVTFHTLPHKLSLPWLCICKTVALFYLPAVIWIIIRIFESVICSGSENCISSDIFAGLNSASLLNDQDNHGGKFQLNLIDSKYVSHVLSRCNLIAFLRALNFLGLERNKWILAPIKLRLQTHSYATKE
jgi:hypothetical protein